MERGSIVGIQFHPEVVHTPRGKEILTNFLVGICGCAPNWTAESFIEAAIREIREQVGDGRVLLGLSGGVDSSVAAALIHRAIGDQLTPVFVDNGLLRLGEAELVREVFGRNFGMHLVFVDASERFLGRLAGVTDPEEKRKIDRRDVRPRLRGGGRTSRSVRVPGPGHALSGRDREHDQGHEGGRQDQDPPQRRRPARRHEVQAGRAAAVPVQGRGARGRPLARAAAGDRRAPAVPRSGPGGAHPR